MMRSLRRPGIVPMMLAIIISPSGVRAMNTCCLPSMPAALSCARMYWRHSFSAADPEGRGPKET
jgi:hypothetical protein